MSIFTKLKQSKKAAKEFKEKKAQEENVVKVPYKHIPSHAAIDALSGAPSTWKVEDRTRIMEHHKRRSQMQMMSHTGSAISFVADLHSAAGMSSSTSQGLNAAHLPRNRSYDRNYRLDQPCLANTASNELNPEKRYRPSRIHYHHDSGIGQSPLASASESDEETSPVSSSGTSTSSSSDHLEIPPVRVNRRSYNRSRNIVPQATIYAETDIFKNLHTSTTRKLGEAPILESPPPLAPIVHTTTPAAVQTPKKNRWSLLGKRNSATIAV